jgi:pimeloyl-ACP methyl ester carboxylesterase
MSSKAWTLDGYGGEQIRGVTQSAEDQARATFVLILAHGFTAHMNFGFLPILSGSLVERYGASVARFTFSHAGVTGADGINIDRHDLFERDTWGKQIFDLGVVFDAIRAATPAEIPVIIAGHSRGGAECLLFAGRRFSTNESPTPDAIIAIEAPDRPGSLTDEDCAQLVRDGWAPVTAPITGQQLRLGAQFGQERLDDPEAFDVLMLCESIGCPVLAVGGERDRLVPPVCSRRIARACPQGEVVIIEGANHMFNTPEPAGAESSASIEALCGAIGRFAKQISA